MRRRNLLTALVAVVALSATACGDGSDDPAATTNQASPTEQQTQTATNPIATAPEATTPPPDAAEPGARTIAPPPETEPAQPPPANTAPAEPPSAEPDPVRVPAQFTIRDGVLDPPAVTVPPFLAIALSVSAADGAAHEVVVRAPQPVELTVPAGEQASVRVPGLRAGRYVVEVDGREAGALDVGGEVGP